MFIVVVVGLIGNTSESKANIRFSFIVKLFINNPFAPASSNFADVYWNKGSISNSKSYLLVSILEIFFSNVFSPPVF